MTVLTNCTDGKWQPLNCQFGKQKQIGKLQKVSIKPELRLLLIISSRTKIKCRTVAVGCWCWLQSRKASMAQIAITMIMGPAAVQQYWRSNEPENCRKPVNMLCMAASSGRCGGADVTIQRSQLTSLHLVLPILYSHHPAPDTVISFHFLATNTSPPSHPHLAIPTGPAFF